MQTGPSLEGVAIRRTLAITTRHFLRLAGTAALLQLPSQLVMEPTNELLMKVRTTGEVSPRSLATAMLAIFTGVLLSFFTDAVIAVQTGAVLAKRAPSLRDGISTAGSRALSLLGLIMLGGAASIAIGCLATVVIVGLGAAGLGAGAPYFPLILVLMLGLVVGIICMTAWWVTIPAIVEENLGAAAALGRSWRLTKGFRGSIFLLVVLSIVFFLVTAVPGILIAMLASPSAGRVVSMVAAVLFATLSAVCRAVCFFEIRRSKEGGAIAQVFA